MRSADLLKQQENRARSDQLATSFDEACKAGDLEKAASLLAEIDLILLGVALGSAQRESALRHMRELRTRLEGLRAGQAAPVARMARALFG